jgi:hypothetical protein
MVNPYDFYGLGKDGSHRRVNHDPVSAAAMSFLAHGVKGAQLGNLHVLLDVMSERLKKEHGVIGRDLFEAHTNYLLETSVLPTIIQKRRLLSMAQNMATHSPKRKYNKPMGHNSGRLAARQNIHRPFIPTKAYHH